MRPLYFGPLALIFLVTSLANATEFVQLKACQKAAGSKLLQDLDHSIQAEVDLIEKTKEAANRASGMGPLKIARAKYDSTQRGAQCDQTYNLYESAITATTPIIKQIDQAIPAVNVLLFEDHKNCGAQLKHFREAYYSRGGFINKNGLGLSLFPAVRAACGQRSPTPFPPAYTLSE